MTAKMRLMIPQIVFVTPLDGLECHHTRTLCAKLHHLGGG